MRPSRARYVAACQRLLALGVVVVALVPAASVVSLDVVAVAPRSPAVPRQPLETTYQHTPREGGLRDHADDLREYAIETTHESEVPMSPVDPVVREVALTPRRPAEPVRPAKPAKEAEILSEPQAVAGLGAVGVTWDSATEVADDEITVQVRTETDGAWSEWSDLGYHEEHGPDPDSEEAENARPGTDGTIVGDVDNVQVRVAMTEGELPADLKLAVVDPGVAAGSELEAPAIDTGELESSQTAASEPTTEPTTEPIESAEDTEDTLTLQGTTFTPKPVIYSRAQWGADESKRDGEPSYFEVHGGFVHHTVNANDYKRADVPAIIRSIYAYHTQSRGWSDIGYNFLVDRFGRIWEGRYGGVDRAVVGAHTLGYNSYSFAMSAIGNFELVQPPAKMLGAFGALMAWKLSLHGVSAASTLQRIGTTDFQAINGHRDAASTACPGKHLYAQIPQIRAIAAAAQADWSGRDPQPNLVGTPAPDLIARRTADNQAMILPLTTDAAGVTTLGRPIATGLSLKKANLVLSVGDWDRDGFNDIATRSKKGALRIRRGDGNGGFVGTPIPLGPGFNSVDMLAAVGDVTGDGYPDLMGQPTGAGMNIYAGGGVAGWSTIYPAYGPVNGTQLVGVGRLDADGAPDVMVRKGSTLTAWSGNGPGGLTGAMPIRVDVTKYDWIVGVGDTGVAGGAPDLVVRKAGKGRLWLLQGGPTGFAAPVTLARGMRAYDLVG